MSLSESQYKKIVDALPNMVWRLGVDGDCIFVNKAWTDFTGRTIESELGNGWVESIHPEDYDRCMAICQAAMDKKEPFEVEYRLRRRDGLWRWVNCRGVPYLEDDESYAGYIGCGMDVSERVEGENLGAMTQKDGLTGFYNRQYFEMVASREFERSRRFDMPVMLVMIDIDNLQNINDTFGHQMGDDVLRKFSSDLKRKVRTHDIVGRYGGDEFALMLLNTDNFDFSRVMKRIEPVLSSHEYSLNGYKVIVSASFGVSSIHEGETFEGLISKADQEMYKMKCSKKIVAE